MFVECLKFGAAYEFLHSNELKNSHILMGEVWRSQELIYFCEKSFQFTTAMSDQNIHNQIHLLVSFLAMI